MIVNLHVFSEGKNLATSHDAKYIETSSGIQHNVDELLVGVVKQVLLIIIFITILIQTILVETILSDLKRR